MALDEHRGPFSPSLWHLPDNKDQRSSTPDKDCKQLWSDWEKVRKDSNTSKNDLQEAWGAVVDGEMHQHLRDSRSELLQVWFPGVHINIGGGNDDLLTEKKSDFERKSTIALINRVCTNKGRNCTHHIRLDVRASRPLSSTQQRRQLG